MEYSMKKRVVVALGHRALGTTLPEQKVAVKHSAKCIADLIEEGYQVAITHSRRQAKDSAVSYPRRTL